jgi:hypothetical protein
MHYRRMAGCIKAFPELSGLQIMINEPQSVHGRTQTANSSNFARMLCANRIGLVEPVVLCPNVTIMWQR